jgi:hypothetical protein
MRSVLAFSAFLLTASSAFGQAQAIEHAPVGCVVAHRFPRLQARIQPDSSRVARARVYFRAHTSGQWYSVDMTKEGDSFNAVLPKPGKTLKQFDYYVSAIDVDHEETRTTEFTPSVVTSRTACGPGQLLSGSMTVASVVVSLPAGAAAAPLVPVGFSAAGVTAAASGGAAAATGAATAGGGGGVSGTTIGAIAGGAAAAVAGVVVAAGGGSDPAPSPAPVACPNVTTTVRLLETSMVCGQREPVTITVQNNSTQSVDFLGLVIAQKEVSGTYCTPGRSLRSTINYERQTVRPGQSLSVDYASDPWCCVVNGSPTPQCTVAGNCSIQQDFAVLTSIGECPGGSATFVVTYGNNCTTPCLR